MLEAGAMDMFDFDAYSDDHEGYGTSTNRTGADYEYETMKHNGTIQTDQPSHGSEDSLEWPATYMLHPHIQPGTRVRLDAVQQDGVAYPHAERLLDHNGQHKHDLQQNSPSDDIAWNAEQQREGVLDDSLQPDNESNEDEVDSEQELLQESWRAYLADDPMELELLPESCPDPDDVDRDEDVSRIEKDATRLVDLEYPEEKWTVDKETIEFLASLNALSAEPALEHVSFALSSSLRDLKLQEPALKTDAQMDMLKLHERNLVQISNEAMQPFPLEDEKDQSLIWPSQYLSLPSKLDQAIEEERLNIDQETIEYLMDIHSGSRLELTDYVMQEHESRAVAKPVTPPLLPLSPPYSPSEPGSSTADVEVTSTPEDPSLLESKQLEDDMFAGDDMAMEEGNHANTQNHGHATITETSSATVSEQTSPSASLKPKRLHESKASSVLLPVDSDEPPNKKAKVVSFDEQSAAMTPQPVSDPTSSNLYETADDILAAVADMIEPQAQKAARQIEQEQLSEADTTSRVPVPHVDPIKVTVPWEESTGVSAGRGLLSATQDEVMRAEKKWSGASRLEKTLPWTPFPTSLAKIRPEGDFDDGSCARYLDELDFDGDVSIDALIWRPDKLMLLHDDEYDGDEIEPAESDVDESDDGAYVNHRSTNVHPDGFLPTSAVASKGQSKQDQRNAAFDSNISGLSGLGALLQKRKLQIEQDKMALGPKGKAKTQTSSSEQAAAARTLITPQTRETPQISNTTNLSNFSKLVGWATPSREIANPHKPASGTSRPTETPAPVSMTTLEPKPSYPLPRLDRPNRPFQIIISLPTAQNHRLTTALRAHLPNIDLIERDFSPTTHEPDLILSPTTALLTTTLQTLKQKPLPGPGRQERTFPNITSRIAAISPTYELLLCLITTDIPTLDDSDAAALNALTNDTVRVILIPNNNDGPRDLSHYIAACVCLHTPTPARNVLIHAETLWERFLRAAGMNVYAAQVVLDAVKPTGPGQGGGGEAGLAAFVMMGHEERVRRFGDVLGGTRVLRRVSRVVDGPWFDRRA